MIRIKVVTDLQEAKNIWRALSPLKTIYDEWDFRYSFYKYNSHPLEFITAYDGAEPVCLLPLEVHPKYGSEYIADDACDDNRVFFKPGYESVIPRLYEAARAPSRILDLAGEDEYTRSLSLGDYKYILPLKDCPDFENFLSTKFSAKSRWHVKKRIKNIENLGVEVIADSHNMSDIFRWNMERFGDDSYLHVDEQKPWLDLLDQPFDQYLILLKINGETAAGSFSIYYKGRYFYLITGVNRNINGLGKYLVKINIERAIALGAEFFDAGVGDCNWKENWHFDRVPQFQFIK